MGAGATTGTAAGVAAMNGARSFGWVAIKWLALGAMGASAVVSVTLLANRPTPPAPPPSLIGATPPGVSSPRETAAPAALPVPSPESALAPEIVPAPGLLHLSRQNRGARQRTSSHPSREAKVAAETASTETTANPRGGPAEGYPADVAKPSATSLRDEIALLEGVRASLAAADIASALRSLERHDAQFPSGALVDEAAVLRVKALMSAGRRDEARRFAQQFSATHPTSTYVSRMRSLLER